MLFDQIRMMLPTSRSLNEAIADVLDISYDAAHRRTSGKSKLSLEEALKLSAYYGLSLDALQENKVQSVIAVKKTMTISSLDDLEEYFKNSVETIQSIIAAGEAHMYYSAKDIPLFHFMDGGLLCRFKIYVWLRLLTTQYEQQSFEKFYLPMGILKVIDSLGTLYKQITKTEIWDATTFNSSLKQIQFYVEAGLLKPETANELCDELRTLLETTNSSIASTTNELQLYHNEFLLMNNTVFIKSSSHTGLIIPFTFLSYVLATDVDTCQQAEDYLTKQLSLSRLMNTAGERSRNIFFGKIQRKIDSLKQLINAQEILDFE
jgi:plasmid maintenance system antidote protein VapI